MDVPGIVDDPDVEPVVLDASNSGNSANSGNPFDADCAFAFG